MSHEIEHTDGKANFVFTGSRQAVWHRLGTEVSDDLTPDEMMKKAGLDWTVSKQPLYQKVGDEYIETKQNALVRDSDGRVLDYVGDTWNPVQNAQAFEFFNDWIGAGMMKMDTAGSLKNGQIVFANAKLGEEFDVFGGDRVEGYLLFTNPHKFGQSINIRTCMERVVCNNTLTVALREETKHNFSQNHRSVFDPDQVKIAMGVAKNQMAKFKEQAEFLGAKLYTVDQMVEYFTKLYPVNTSPDRKQRVEVSKNAKLLMEIVDTQPGADYAPGSFWNLFNATTFANDHLFGRSDETRGASTLYGIGAAKKLQALNLALEMAN